MASKIVYEVHPRKLKNVKAVARVPDGKGGYKTVGLIAKVTRNYPANPFTGSAAWSETYPKATQGDLQYLSEMGFRDRDQFPLVIAKSDKVAAVSNS